MVLSTACPFFSQDKSSPNFCPLLPGQVAELMEENWIYLKMGNDRIGRNLEQRIRGMNGERSEVESKFILGGTKENIQYFCTSCR